MDRKKRGITPHLPTLAMFLNAKSVDMDDPESKNIATWYASDWMSMLCGPLSWGDRQKKFKMMVGKTMIGGENKICVTITTQAFGCLIWENCMDKWHNSFVFKEKNPEVRLPQGRKQDPDGLYRAKFSDSCDGQVKGGGWQDLAFQQYNKYIVIS